MKKIVFICTFIGIFNLSCNCEQLRVSNVGTIQNATTSTAMRGEKIVLGFFMFGVMLLGVNKRLGDYC